jgi:hypothetical protein
MQNLEISLSLPGIQIEQTKVFTVFSKDNKKAYLSGKKLRLHEFNLEFGESFIQISSEEAKRKHLGKVKSIGTILTQEQLVNVLKKYFSIVVPVQVPVSKKVNLNQIVDKNLTKISENELVLRYRASSNEREKNKIFNTILFERGTSGKTWDVIIKNYISYNKFKYKHIVDYNENDFYQEVVIALHKEVEKWFNPNEQVKFSTYAWYVIHSAFHRVLQSLSTQKRKVAYQSNNIDLDNNDVAWDEMISSEKIMGKFVPFDEELENKDMCEHIQDIFELKEVNIDPVLKDELIKVIKNKSVIRGSLYTLSKKYNVPVEELFKIELIIRTNLKNSMYNDILLFMKHGINADKEIAKKYNRSKGHVIKMKRQLGQIVRTKMKEMA